MRTGCAGSDRRREANRELSKDGRVADGKGGRVAGETFVYQRSARQRADGRYRVSRAERVQTQDGVETPAQDRQGTVRPDGCDPDAEQASHPHPGRGSRDGRDENSAAAHHWRTGSRDVCERARRRFIRMPQISGPDVGTGKQFRESGARLAQIRGATPGLSVANRRTLAVEDKWISPEKSVIKGRIFPSTSRYMV